MSSMARVGEAMTSELAAVYPDSAIERKRRIHQRCTLPRDECHGDYDHCVVKACDDFGWPCPEQVWLNTYDAAMAALGRERERAEAAERRVTALRGTLDFYATPRSWQPTMAIDLGYPSSAVAFNAAAVDDAGDRARAALAGE